MFSRGSLRSISLATVTPSLVIVGDPNFLSRTTLRPLGPSVTFTASASWLTPRSTAWRECSPYTICFAIAFVSREQVSRPSLLFFLGPAFDDRQHFVFAHDDVFLAIELDLLSGVLPEQDEIAGFHIERRALPVVFDFAASGRNDFALLGLFLGRVGNDDPPDFLFAFFKALNKNPVVQWSDVHALYSVWRKGGGAFRGLDQDGPWG